MALPPQSSLMANTNINSTSTPTQNGVPLTASSSGSSTNNSSNIGTFDDGTSVEFKPLLNKSRLMELIREVDPSTQLDKNVEELLMRMVDDFIDDAVKNISTLAKHRKSKKIEERDIHIHLDCKYGNWIPGFGTDVLRSYKRVAVTEAHKQRLALIRKPTKNTKASQSIINK